MDFCNCSMICCALLCYHSSFAIILMGKRDLVALLSLQFVIVVFPDHTHLLFNIYFRFYDIKNPISF